MVRRGVRSEQGSAIVEMILVLPLLLALIFGSLALAMGAIAKAVVENAARDAGRVASIECGQDNPNWQQDAQNAALDGLDQGLHVDGRPSVDPVRYGQWSFMATCPVLGTPGVPVTTVITYDEVNVFPPASALLGAPAMSRVFRLQAAVQFPAE